MSFCGYIIQTSYYLHNQKLEVTDCARYRGVDISQNLSFNNNIDCTCNSASKTLGFLRHNLNPLPIVSFGTKWIHPDVIDKDKSGLSPRKIVTCACFLHLV